jgi:hypothetical protein
VDFWEQVGEFFATFEPKDWVTSVVAAIAIVVSLISLHQTRLYHPRPYVRLRSAVWGRDPDSDLRPYLHVTATNYGTGPALDAAWIVRTPAKLSRVGAWRRLGPSLGSVTNSISTEESSTCDVSIITGLTTQERGKGTYLWPEGVVLRGLYVFVYHWRQPPDRFRRFRILVRIASKRSGEYEAVTTD